MRVILVPPKNNYPDTKPSLDIFGQGFPYIAGALKEAGHEVFGVNINTRWCHGSAQLELKMALRTAIEECQPHFIGVGGQSADYLFVRDAISFIREITADIPIVCGGGIVTCDPIFIVPNLRPDFAVIGEGEEVIVKLASYLERGGDINAVPNIAFWEGGKPVYPKFEYTNKNIDGLPLPDYDPFDYKTYLESLNQADNNLYAHTRHRPRVIPITLGRSCPFKCTFCCHTTGTEYRERSIDNTIEEIIHFYEQYKFNILFIYDELFSLHKERIREFCRKIKMLKEDLNIDFDWTCAQRVNQVDEEMLVEMRDAGCIFIGYGFESASPKVLKSMKKGITVEQIIRAIKLTEEVGIGIQGNFILGDIAETQETIQETKLFFEKWCTDLMVHFNYLTPYPGSEIFEYSVRNDIIRDKREYYEYIGPIGKYKINMTKIPDEIFFSTVNDIVDITDPLKYNCLKLKEGAVLTCERRGKFEGDSEGPPSMHRSLYEIKCICPHCRNIVDYLYPLRTLSYFAGPVGLYCSKCHKRFVVNVSKYVSKSLLESSKGLLKEFVSKMSLRLQKWFLLTSRGNNNS